VTIDGAELPYCRPHGHQFGRAYRMRPRHWSWYTISSPSHNRNPLAKVRPSLFTCAYTCSAVRPRIPAPFLNTPSSQLCHLRARFYRDGSHLYQVRKPEQLYSGTGKTAIPMACSTAVTTTPTVPGPGTILTSPWSPLTHGTPYNTAAYRLTASWAGRHAPDQMDAL